jgi:hypothetical protein
MRQRSKHNGGWQYDGDSDHGADGNQEAEI